jgi:hypothetical protein
VLRVTVTEAALQAGRFSARSWLVVKAVDWLDCGEAVLPRPPGTWLADRASPRGSGCGARGGGVAAYPRRHRQPVPIAHARCISLAIEYRKAAYSASPAHNGRVVFA